MKQLDLQPVAQMVARLGVGPEACIPILQAIQEHYHYLPTEALTRVCELTRITPAQIAGVASFYTQFRVQPAGAHLVRVCHGTACHVRGSGQVHAALERHLRIPADGDTSPDGQHTLERVACLGCCTLAPVVQIGAETFGHINPAGVPRMLAEYQELLAAHAVRAHAHAPLVAGGNAVEIRVGLGSCCMAKGSHRVFAAVEEEVARLRVPATVKRVGCVGMCHRTPLLEIVDPGQAPILYAQVTPAAAAHLVRRHLKPRGWRALTHWMDRVVESLAVGDTIAGNGNGNGSGTAARGKRATALRPDSPEVSAFLTPQVRIATEHFGCLDPLDLDEYQARDGFAALHDMLRQGRPEELIATLTASGLRGRGGGGFPTGRKWRTVRDAVSADGLKYVICNGDEGDPGAFMDRMLLESFPYRILEGMMLAGLAVGASEGIFYIRAEYPLAVARVEEALRKCQERGLVGKNVLGAGWDFQVRIQSGAGAFVCGEETALIASLEGRRGMPRLRPPYPAQQGLWQRPTLVNNVETLAMVPWIIRHGAGEFARHGTSGSKGTKVFALAGKVKHGGLIEVPMGVTLRQIVTDIGGGVDGAGDARDGAATFKAVQIGGPSGGCVPASLADTPVDFEALAEVGAIMGSGGLVVLDQSDCMVDIARYFLAFTQDQSCGKCTFCRLGTKRMLEILERLCAGKGKPADLGELEALALQVQGGSLCGLGRTAPNPVLTTLRYFRDEYEAHLAGRCPAGKCKALIRYRITAACNGCAICARECPEQAIPLTPYRVHTIDMDKCTRCDTCRAVCPVPGAVRVE